jgi:hypothetical protein
MGAKSAGHAQSPIGSVKCCAHRRRSGSRDRMAASSFWVVGTKGDCGFASDTMGSAFG